MRNPLNWHMKLQKKRPVSVSLCNDSDTLSEGQTSCSSHNMPIQLFTVWFHRQTVTFSSPVALHHYACILSNDIMVFARQGQATHRRRGETPAAPHGRALRNKRHRSQSVGFAFDATQDPNDAAAPAAGYLRRYPADPPPPLPPRVSLPPANRTAAIMEE